MQMTLRPTAGRTLRLALLAAPFVLGLGMRLSAQNTYATPYTFGVFAGEGANGGADGTGSTAFFNQPAGLAADSSGNVYVADLGNNDVREVTSAAVVTTLAGYTGYYGTTDATGSAARFKLPFGVTVDSKGDVFVADTDNNTIRKVTPAGVVTTLAGSAGIPGYSNATGASAEFNQPGGVALDSSGNVYVTDTDNQVIRMVTPTGVVTTFAGLADYAGSTDATGSAAGFNLPTGIASDSNGNLFVADTGNNTIRKVTSAGAVTTIAGLAGVGGSADGTGSAARFNSPRGIAVDGSGNLLVADSANGLIRKVTQAGVVTTIAGALNTYANASGIGSQAQFDVPVGIAVDGNGNVYVSQRNGNVISKGTLTPTAAPSITSQPAGQTVVSGATVVFRTSATGQPLPTYQWKLNGTALQNGGPISGATGTVLIVTGAAAANAGTYTCTATSSAGSATTAGAALAIAAGGTTPGHLVNLSARAAVASNTDVLIAGFVTTGQGSKSLIVRGIGPSLGAAPFNVPGFLALPDLTLYDASENLITEDKAWTSAPTQPVGPPWAGVAAPADATNAEFTQVGAFALGTSSADTAVAVALPAGAFTSEVTGQAGSSGVALAEIYDADTGTPTSTLVNLSARAYVGTSQSVLIAGFVIGGDTSLTVLIRASGPALLQFGVPDTLADPKVQLVSGSTTVAANTKWGGDPAIFAVADEVGAFSWDLSSADSALLVTLPPGAYTALVSGATGDSGVALVEVYAVP
jgi:hypothetical protein